MTVNELIETLKETGDEDFRNMAEVNVIFPSGAIGLDERTIDKFDVKSNIKSVDIHLD